MMTFRIITIALISAFFIFPIQNINTCSSSYEYDETRISFYNPAMIPSKNLFPFFYSFAYLNEQNIEIKDDIIINCREWAKYAGIDDLGETQNAIYKSTLEDFVENRLNENEFIKSVKKRNQLAYKVLYFAKKNEFAHFNSNNPWHFRKHEMSQELISDKDQTINLLLEGLELMKNTEGDYFLQKRVAFQLLRIYRFQKDINAASKLFHFFHTDNASIIDAWAWMQEAALKYEKDTLGALLLQAEVFHHSEDKRRAAFIAYTRNPKTQEKVLAHCKDKNMKASVAALNAIDNPGKALEEIRRVYNYDDNNKFLHLLIAREITKLDDWLKEYELTGFEPRHTSYVAMKDYFTDWYEENRDSEGNYIYPTPQQIKAKNLANFNNDINYCKSIIDLLENELPALKANSSDFVNISLAHLYNLLNEPKQTEKYLNSISPKAHQNIQLQMEIEKLILLPKLKEITTIDVKNEIANSLNFIRSKRNLIDNASKVIGSIELYLSKEFLKKDDVVTAGLLHYKSCIGNKYYDTKTEYSDFFDYTYKPQEYNWGQPIKNEFQDEYEVWREQESFYLYISFYDRHASPQHIDELLILKKEKARNNLHQYAYPTKWASDQVYYDLKGTLHFRASEFKEAAKAFANVQDSFWQKKYSFKYYLKKDPFINTDALEKTSKSYLISKTKTALKMDSLTNLINKKPTADDCFQLALAYYNTSTYSGNNWIMFNYGKSLYENENYDYVNGESTYYKSRNYYAEDYYKNKRVYELLQKALTLNPTYETAAKIQFLLHTSDFNSYESTTDYWDEDAEKFKPIYIEDFVTKYKDTKFFQSVKQCLLENEYIK